ncbi:sulfatase-like hydrolase/transferase [Methylobacillus gramineus]|uniref:sulfatase family protein n=1 Tax=Methylobacillus gramineus TaxID=755169 RepID=UPI001CFFB6A9|nr:sulfatase-like hydrolase/transferase [Methylobacillus gramineus]MCB5184640.1 sulfatase-like hydrolase/transferase [Methylobacillus gramineus]
MTQFKQKRRQILQAIPAMALLPYSGLTKAALETTKTKKPNIIFIMADDLGYADLGVYGQTAFKTPNLDKVAYQGLRFTQGYANSAVCSATRFALITGRYQYRLRGGLEEPLAGRENLGLPPEHPTLPSQLKKVGYNTALFGKWHLGSLPTFGPLKSGYDVFFGNYSGAVDYFTHKYGVGDEVPGGLYEGEVPVNEVGYYTDLIADHASQYIGKQTEATPFFLSLHFTAPHWPWEAPGDEAVSREIKNLFHLDGGSLATYGKMVEALDTAVGRVLATLEKQGLADNTIIVFTSDNGGERFSNTWPFSGQKTELLEGGIRVPTLVRWPARIKAGQVSDQVAISMDWLPTLLAAAGTTPDSQYAPDGENLLPILLGEAAIRPRQLFWRYKGHEQAATRSADWKYLKINGNEYLFNLAKDPRERANLAAKHPQELAQLKAQWQIWNSKMLPITADVRSHSVNGDMQADRYGVKP